MVANSTRVSIQRGDGCGGRERRSDWVVHAGCEGVFLEGFVYTNGRKQPSAGGLDIQWVNSACMSTKCSAVRRSRSTWLFPLLLALCFLVCAALGPFACDPVRRIFLILSLTSVYLTAVRQSMDVRQLTHLAKLAALLVAKFALSLSLLKVRSLHGYNSMETVYGSFVIGMGVCRRTGWWKKACPGWWRDPNCGLEPQM